MGCATHGNVYTQSMTLGGHNVTVEKGPDMYSVRFDGERDGARLFPGRAVEGLTDLLGRVRRGAADAEQVPVEVVHDGGDARVPAGRRRHERRGGDRFRAGPAPADVPG